MSKKLYTLATAILVLLLSVSVSFAQEDFEGFEVPTEETPVVAVDEPEGISEPSLPPVDSSVPLDTQINPLEGRALDLQVRRTELRNYNPDRQIRLEIIRAERREELDRIKILYEQSVWNNDSVSDPALQQELMELKKESTVVAARYNRLIDLYYSYLSIVNTEINNTTGGFDSANFDSQLSKIETDLEQAEMNLMTYSAMMENFNGVTKEEIDLLSWDLGAYSNQELRPKMMLIRDELLNLIRSI